MNSRLLPRLAALLGRQGLDGLLALYLLSLGLVLSGLVALWLAATRHLLPHDTAYLGMVVQQVCGTNDGRILQFMFHDRAAFGGAVLATGVLYGWLAVGPLRQGLAWAWWTLALSGLLGFSSFLAYLGYGYLDTWHALATLVLLPLFGWGLVRRWGTLRGARSLRANWRAAAPTRWRSRAGASRAGLLAIASGIAAAGFTIMGVGMTGVFVPQDLTYMNLTIKQLSIISPNLIPLIAHDRAGFGGALLACGFTMLGCVWGGAPGPGLWRVLAWAGGIGFATAIGVHPLIGYTDLTHLAPALVGLLLFSLSLWGSYPAMHTHRAAP
jgi:hypothetical protein